MKTRRLLFVILLLVPAVTTADAAENSKYVTAVRTFADNVLEYGKGRTYDNAAIYSRTSP
jgi:hypothetical protein